MAKLISIARPTSSNISLIKSCSRLNHCPILGPTGGGGLPAGGGGGGGLPAGGGGLPTGGGGLPAGGGGLAAGGGGLPVAKTGKWPWFSCALESSVGM